MEDICCIADLRYKEVINTSTGERLGYVGDLEIDIAKGEVKSVIIKGKLRFFGLFGRKNDIIVPWNSIDRIGEDIILTHESRFYNERQKNGERDKFI